MRFGRRDIAAQRELLLRDLERAGASLSVLESMRVVPREEFVPEALREQAYEDGALPIGGGQTISQPRVVATMVDALELAPTDRVLEVGTGSGYAAAVLSRLCAHVYGTERLPELAEAAAARLAALGFDNVSVRATDGTRGLPDEAPFDAISVAAGGAEIPPALLEQLAPGGRLVMPVGESDLQELVLVRRFGGERFERRSLGAVRFVPLVGGT